MYSAVLRCLMFLSVLTCHASFPEMIHSEKDACFRAQALKQGHKPFCHDGDFKSQRSKKCGRSYEQLYKDGVCADMVFGTACDAEGKCYDAFLPSCKQIHFLMKRIQDDAVSYVTKNAKITAKDDWSKVIGVYPLRFFHLALEHPSGFVKVPYTEEGLTEHFCADLQKLSGEVRYCFILGDVFNTGETWAKVFLQVLNAVLPKMEQTSRDHFKVVFAAAYLQGGGEAESAIQFGTKAYPLHAINFRDSALSRLRQHVRLHIMDDFLEQRAQRLQREIVFAVDEKAKSDVLRAILFNSEALWARADDRYCRYIDNNFIYAIKFDDFVGRGWIDREPAKDLQIVMPRASMSPHKVLNVTELLGILFEDEGIQHCLEPILYLPEEGIILHTPVEHALLWAKSSGLPNQHEANVLALYPGDRKHYTVDKDWLKSCQSRLEWKQEETIGVILLNPYEELPGQRHPTKESHPHLLKDVRSGIEKGLNACGCKALFVDLFYDGFCLWETMVEEYTPVSKKKASSEKGDQQDPPIEKKCTHDEKLPHRKPSKDKLLSDTVRIVWKDNLFLRKTGLLDDAPHITRIV